MNKKASEYSFVEEGFITTIVWIIVIGIAIGALLLLLKNLHIIK